RADHPVMRAYLHTALTCRIPPETMRPYFRAMRDDLTITRFPTFADLLYYIEGSALPVGRAMTHILGVRAPQTLEQTLPHADSLATAMQLSNFWRDIAEDWERGRIYLPLEDMQRFGVAEAELSQGGVSPAFAALLRFEIARTEPYYRYARAGVPCLATGRWGVMSSLHIYHTILRDIRRRRYDVFTRRAGANQLEKFACATLAWWETNGLRRCTINANACSFTTTSSAGHKRAG
ncbi:MAG: phytoene/squalene synthase family protein, partial [Anaerolineae bacterium]|nr:phytoene/squalene synthase family protein [Anaerolineae bacterium]